MSKTIFEIEAVIGAKPSPGSINFKRWLLSYIDYRINTECPLVRDNQINYYFSSSGNDANDGLSVTMPKASISGFRTLFYSLSPTGTYRFNFRAGDTFRWAPTATTPYATGDAIFATGISNIVLTSYEDPAIAAPGRDSAIITAWHPVADIIYPGSGWIQSATANVYQVATTGTRPWWVKNNNNDYMNGSVTGGIYAEMPNAADCASRSGSFHWSSNVLYVSAHDGSHPSGKDLYVTQSDYGGIVIGGATADKVRIHKLISDGFTIGTADNAYNIYSNVGDANSWCVTNCGAYYGGKHLIGNIVSNPGSGGFAVYAYNSGGLFRYDTAGETQFVAYSFNGANEYVFYRNHGTHGAMISGLVGACTGFHGSHIYGHTGGTQSPTFGLLMENKQNMTGYLAYGTPNYVGDFRTLPVASGGNPNLCSGFLVDEVMDLSIETSISALPYNNLCLINPILRCNLTRGASPTVSQIVGNNGIKPQVWYINPQIYTIISSGNYGSIRLFGSSSSATRHCVNFLNGLVSFDALLNADVSSAAGGMNVYGGHSTILSGIVNADWGGRSIAATNTIFCAKAVGTNTRNLLNLQNSAVNASGSVGISAGFDTCAFFNYASGDYVSVDRTYQGYNRSTGPVTLTGFIPTGYIPTSASPLWGAGTSTLSGFTLEYDARWHRRANNVIGPYDNTAPSSVTLPSGTRFSHFRNVVSGSFTVPVENDLRLRVYRLFERDFAPGTLITSSNYPDITGFVDSGLKRAGRYTYMIQYLDAADNAVSFSTGVLVGPPDVSYISSATGDASPRLYSTFTNRPVANQIRRGIYQTGSLEPVNTTVLGINGFRYNAGTPINANWYHAGLLANSGNTVGRGYNPPIIDGDGNPEQSPIIV